MRTVASCRQASTATTETRATKIAMATRGRASRASRQAPIAARMLIGGIQIRK